VGNLIALSETPGSVKGNPPELGEANTELLSELGFNDAELTEIERVATQQQEETRATLLAMADAVEQ
jgi:crotonobetainyl-CoA:carnitine CoA-transferase CaiB-like acyl-CoA transferase